MIGNFEQCLAFVLKSEGGYVDDPNDPGGATKFGVTLNTMSNWRKTNVTKDDMRDLTINDVMPIYRQWYWDRCRCDQLPSGVDYCVFDAAVNSGCSQSVKFLQAALNVTVDGLIGPHTIGASSQRDASELIEQFCEERLHFMQSLRTWNFYGKGWSARVESVKQAALQMS
jgi:hypothetical protein